ncbi:uncharacterized protein EV154DRAFT_547726 [Mucor mucedo]|uniref:uncharacterized protein n=1 Tax=Mucor mucedo TaxID=29922 RepID=UPI00221FCCF0|nr:uncharacterized protein EV154DRAFT_547726 [Mucor mucedo]KAI7896061.1 hypothetical protein EV154DRAFT_547726 [Mucor mucedo]
MFFCTSFHTMSTPKELVLKYLNNYSIRAFNIFVRKHRDEIVRLSTSLSDIGTPIQLQRYWISSYNRIARENGKPLLMVDESYARASKKLIVIFIVIFILIKRQKKLQRKSRERFVPNKN